MDASCQPPEGTVVMLFTDIEGSTRLARALGSSWARVLADHHALVGGAIAAEGGFIDGTEGDAFFATFREGAAGARAAVAALRALRAHNWPQGVGELRVRMGLHIGHVERHATGYVGLELHRAARVAAAAHGGQLLLTGEARAVAADVVVVEPLGLHRLKDFPTPEELFCAVVDGRGASAFPAPRTEELRQTNLPAGLAPLVGRDADLERIRGALTGDRERLVTLTGRGGVGKTSLALVAATEMLDQHRGGVWMVTLAGVSSPVEVLAAVASVVGAEGEPGDSPLQALTTRLHGRGPTLVVLDNMEHLLAAAAELAALLDGLPDLRLLVTSQAPLRLPGERCLLVDSLADEAAMELMERVASRRGAPLSAGDANRAALLEVAHLLDSVPLALELAAARLALLSPTQLVERLRGSSDVLKDAGSARPERQRSLRATVEWTLGLLEDPPRELFARLGVFAGPVELEEVELIAGADGLDVVEALAGLLDVALLRRVESGDGRVRFGLPQALRHIAAGLLDDAPDGLRWRRAHAQRQLDLVWAARMWWPSQTAYRAALGADTEAAAALHWARESGDALAAPLGVARASLLMSCGRVREGRAEFEPLLERPSGDPAVDDLARMMNASALVRTGRSEEARSPAELVIATAVDPGARVWGLIVRARVAEDTGEPDSSVRYTEHATKLARELGPLEHSRALSFESQARMHAGDLRRAAKQLAEAASIGTPVEAQWLSTIESQWGDLARVSGQPQEALKHYAESLEAAQARGDALQITPDLQTVATCLAALHQDTAALEVAGLAQAHAHELNGQALDAPWPIWLGDDLANAEARVGAEIAADLKASGHALPGGSRVTRACQLARAHQHA